MKKSYIAPECTSVKLPESFCQTYWTVGGASGPRTNQQY